MARKGLFRRLIEKVTAPAAPKPKPTPAAKPAPAPKPKLSERIKRAVTPKRKRAPKPKPTPAVQIPKPKPSPQVAREQLYAKLHDMYWLQKKYDSAAVSKRIDKMTDKQVYAALDMTEDQIETAVRKTPSDAPQWADPDDPNCNILWYGGMGAVVA